MDIDFTPFFQKYESLVYMADHLFGKIKKEYPECVTCKIECSDCCHALFDLSLIEAMYLNHHFNETFSGSKKEVLIEKANRADRKVYQLKRKAYKDFQKGTGEGAILEQMARERLRCPLLNDQEMCDLYAYRPITCRLYGIPTSIGGRSYTCGLSGFKEGKKYPSVNIDTIQKQLYEISSELAQTIKSKYPKIADILVPVSMAMLTTYDETYLGMQDDHKKEKS